MIINRNSFITNKWNSYLTLIPEHKKDIYFTEEYVKLYEDEHKKALCYVYFAYPFVLLMPIIRNDIDGIFFDFETPYGYGGPITNSDDINWIAKALNEMKTVFLNENYIAGFIRFHPLLDNALFCKESISVMYDRKTVYIDLVDSLDTIWTTQLSAKNRNMIRKAEKQGCSFMTDFEFANLATFIDLYNDTMRRLDADTFYFFPQKYYSHFSFRLINNSFLGMLKKDDDIVISSLFMHYSGFGHYHLSGTNHQYGGANNLLLWNVIKILQNGGVQKFHLGGGNSSSPEDPLFKFKKSFSKNTGDFYIGKMIYNEEKYRMLCETWEQNNPDKITFYDKYVLKYRY
jgi:hypothetical protein